MSFNPTLTTKLFLVASHLRTPSLSKHWTVNIPPPFIPSEAPRFDWTVAPKTSIAFALLVNIINSLVEADNRRSTCIKYINRSPNSRHYYLHSFYAIRIMAFVASAVGKIIVKVPLVDVFAPPKSKMQTAGLV